jgi:hypothetical protein
MHQGLRWLHAKLNLGFQVTHSVTASVSASPVCLSLYGFSLRQALYMVMLTAA